VASRSIANRRGLGSLPQAEQSLRHVRPADTLRRPDDARAAPPGLRTDANPRRRFRDPAHRGAPRSPKCSRVTKTASESEKITINLGYVDLGHIDLLVQDGFYTNRTDFIRTAIRNQVDRHGETARQSVSRRNLDLGLRTLTRGELEAARASQQPLEIRVLGLVTIAPDVTADLARAAIASISVLGTLQASPAVKAALADRVRQPRRANTQAPSISTNTRSNRMWRAFRSESTHAHERPPPDDCYRPPAVR
jgi:Arc/MetJ-type ribon-helix-helix transcriptional regulator